MKLVTVENISDSRQWLGALHEDGSDRIVDLKAAATAKHGEAFAEQFDTMLALINAGDDAVDAARSLLDAAERSGGAPDNSVDQEHVKYKSPIPTPPQIRDCLMFEDHLVNAYDALRNMRAQLEPDPEAALKLFEEKGLYRVPDVWYERPIYYKANRFAVIGHEEDVVTPKYADVLDFELEFGCFLKRPIKDIDESDVNASIFGYSIFNDISAREIQSREMQGQLGPAKGKDFDTANIIGPCIVTADAVDPQNMTMVARINGEEVARGNAETAHWTFEKVISYMSVSETLVPGEFIASGTVGGGCGLECGRFLKVGDVIELDVEGIGVMRNRIT